MEAPMLPFFNLGALSIRRRTREYPGIFFGVIDKE